jgi:sugar phosphate isomerase/epimerase
VLYEPQGTFVNGVKNFGIFFEEMKKRGCNVKICGDIGNCLFVDEAPDLFFKAYAKDIVHVHLKDYIINRQDEMPELLWDRSKGGNMLAETEIGTGIVKFDACMQALKEAGYSGSFAIESVLTPYRETMFARDMQFMREKYPFF